jgi:methylated-DNA-[protein]-cysteine S-methyltransferase
MLCSFTVFETPIGTGAIAWSERGVTGVQLPETDLANVRAQVRRRFPRSLEAPPPPQIQQAIDGITTLLRGESADLSSVELDLEDVPPFERQVYEIARTVPAGETISYGQLAARLGDARFARDVGQALAHNPFALVVPCHRVIAAGGRLGGFSARGGLTTKQRLLSIERANVSWQLPLGG